ILVRDDPDQAEAADRFVENGGWISILALAETVWVLRSVYGVDARALTTAVEMLLDHAKLTLQGPDVVSEALSLFPSRRKLSFSDCLLLEMARKAGHLPLGTFDRGLGRAEGTRRL